MQCVFWCGINKTNSAIWPLPIPSLLSSSVHLHPKMYLLYVLLKEIGFWCMNIYMYIESSP